MNVLSDNIKLSLEPIKRNQILSPPSIGKIIGNHSTKIKSRYLPKLASQLNLVSPSSQTKK
jgi:hypothetical protein